MHITLRELELQPLDFHEEFAPGAIDLGADLKQVAPLLGTGRAELVHERHGKHDSLLDIRLHGSLVTSVELACARCLEPVATEVQRSYDLLYRPQGVDADSHERNVTAAESEVGYYSGDALLLEDALREQVLLALPLRVLCGEDCRGLCANCGRNRNEGPCGCDEKTDDLRWSALKDLRTKLET
jgi:uncharacterized protein